MRAVVLWGSLVAAFATAAPCDAQAKEPVRGRMRIVAYGHAGSTDASRPVFDVLRVSIDGRGVGDGGVRVSGGTPGALAIVVIGTARAAVPLGGNALLWVGGQLAPAAAAFDARGELHLPIDWHALGFFGQDLFVQAATLTPDAAVQVSGALALRMFAGNDQPPAVDYVGPELTTVLLQDRTEGVRHHRVLFDIILPTAGYDVIYALEVADVGPAVIRLTLVAPQGPTLPVLVRHQRMLDVGELLGVPEIHVLVAQTVRGGDADPGYQLAAVINAELDWGGVVR